MEADSISFGFKTCPVCGENYHGPSALSRKDGKTQICPDCGTREALKSLGISLEEQEKILASIHSCYGNRNPLSRKP